jgi:methylated-DNA-[protein]-cysteine S-methyltransferase/AraC family transcriptional regulator of adaptative response/methylated-DNA-[protein]-cysteine methyltransferase
MQPTNIKTSINATRPVKPLASGDDHILFSVGDSPVGKVLVARTIVGVCAVLIGASRQALESDLEARFPGRTLVGNAAKVQDDLDKVVQFIAAPHGDFNLPLDMRHGTAFQRRVWDALLTIPCGARISYSALARRIGEPNAVRAVASACAANAIALGIPCHRVVRNDGTISGYRWGTELKRSLLDKEKAVAVN